MTYLAYFIASLQVWFSKTKGMPLSEGIYRILQNAVKINESLLWICSSAWLIIVLVIFVIIALALINRRRISIDMFPFASAISGCIGCFGTVAAIQITLLPLFRWIGLKISIFLASNYHVDGSIDDPIKFYLLIAYMIIFGIG